MPIPRILGAGPLRTNSTFAGITMTEADLPTQAYAGCTLLLIVTSSHRRYIQRFDPFGPSSRVWDGSRWPYWPPLLGSTDEADQQDGTNDGFLDSLPVDTFRVSSPNDPVPVAMQLQRFIKSDPAFFGDAETIIDSSRAAIFATPYPSNEYVFQPVFPFTVQPWSFVNDSAVNPTSNGGMSPSFTCQLLAVSGGYQARPSRIFPYFSNWVSVVKQQNLLPEAWPWFQQTPGSNTFPANQPTYQRANVGPLGSPTYSGWGYFQPDWWHDPGTEGNTFHFAISPRPSVAIGSVVQPAAVSSFPPLEWRDAFRLPSSSSRGPVAITDLVDGHPFSTTGTVYGISAGPITIGAQSWSAYGAAYPRWDPYTSTQNTPLTPNEDLFTVQRTFATILSFGGVDGTFPPEPPLALAGAGLGFLISS